MIAEYLTGCNVVGLGLLALLPIIAAWLLVRDGVKGRS